VGGILIKKKNRSGCTNEPLDLRKRSTVRECKLQRLDGHGYGDENVSTVTVTVTDGTAGRHTHTSRNENAVYRGNDNRGCHFIWNRCKEE